MTAIGYGIIIGGLIGLLSFISLIAGAALMLKVKNIPNWQPFDFLGPKEGDGRADKEREKIMQAGRVKPANYDGPPRTAEEFHADFKRDGFHEELPSGKGN